MGAALYLIVRISRQTGGHGVQSGLNSVANLLASHPMRVERRTVLGMCKNFVMI